MWTDYLRLVLIVNSNEQEHFKSKIKMEFQKIYKDANDDVRKAMIKSFTESKGTVLSTNWNEVKKQEVEMKPPEDAEFKEFPK